MMNISKNKCVGCGICESECPKDSITVDLKMGIAVFDRDRCIYCGLCLRKCPQGAIKDIAEDLVFAIGTDNEEIIKPDEHFAFSLVSFKKVSPLALDAGPH
jgi:ferredoxin